MWFNAIKAAASSYMLLIKFIGAAILLGLVWWAVHAYNDGLREQGRSEIQVKFDAYRTEVDRLATERETANRLKDAQVIATNEAALNDYQSKLADIIADRDSLAKRLRNSQARTCRATGAQADNRPAVITTSPESSSEEAVDRYTERKDAALDELDSACRQDAAQLDALIRQLMPQL